MKRKSKDQKTMYEFMEERARFIEKYVHRNPAAVGRYVRASPQLMQQARAKANTLKLAMPSDPFMYQRVLHQLTTGLGELSDYNAEFARHVELLDGPNGTIEKVVHEPINLKLLSS